MYYLSFLFIDNIILLTFQCEDNSCRITHTVQWDAFYFREIWFKINENLYVWWRLQFTLSSLPWWGDFDAMVLSKLASSDEISWWRCNVIIGTLSQSPNCKWNWSHVTFIFDPSTIKSNIFHLEIFNILNVYIIYDKWIVWINRDG